MGCDSDTRQAEQDEKGPQGRAELGNRKMEKEKESSKREENKKEVENREYLRCLPLPTVRAELRGMGAVETPFPRAIPHLSRHVHAP